MYTSALALIGTPSRSDSVNFWFCARSSSRLALAATETSFPVGHAPNSRASLADTSEIERSIGIGVGVGAGWDSAHQWSPPELHRRPLRQPVNVYKRKLV